MGGIRGKAPVTWEEWRDIYHEEAKAMGWAASTYLAFKAMRLLDDPVGQGSVRSVWRHKHRLERIERQLDEASDRNDPTMLAAVYRMVMGWGESTSDSE